MKKKALIILLISLIVLKNYAICQFQIKVKSTNTVDSIAYFRGVVFDDKNFIPKDTIELYKETNIIKNAKPIIGGIYYLYFPKTKQKIYLTIDNKDTLSISFSDSSYLNTIKTKNSKNDSFFAYQRIEKKLLGFDSLYEYQINNGRKFNQVQKAAFFQPKNLKLAAARNIIMKTLKPESSLYIYFDELNNLDNSIPNKKNYEGRIKFLKIFDINNPKLLFNSNLKQVYSKYLSYYPLNADSIIKGVDTIMHKLDCKSKAYSYTFDYLIKLLKNRDIQNNTIAYSYFINKYVKENKCKFLDPKIEKQLLEELENVNKMKLMDSSSNIVLKDTAGVKQDLHEFAKKFNYTLITFFDPSCAHCKVELPKMDATIKKIEKDLVLNIGIYVICNDLTNQTDLWKGFIKDYNLNLNYIHVNLEENNEIRKAYDAFSNPLFYLINSDGKFVGKKLSPNTLKKIIIADIQSIKN